MKYSKAIIGLCFILCILLTVSSACASDVSDNVTDEISASEDIPEIELDDNNDVIGETDNGTFTALQEKISAGYGSTITLENDYQNNDSFVSSGIKITDNITIDGQYHKIDAKNNGSIFHITGSNVTLKNIIFVNARYENAGGAIYSVAKYLEISNCSFINNTVADNFIGGAVYTGAVGSCKISDCNFTNNTAYNGGAICYNDMNGTSIITGCTFEDNIATNCGGAIWLANGEKPQKYTVSQSVFKNNKAKSGGAIYTDKDINTTIEFSDFSENTAYFTGSAISSLLSNGVTVYGCVFVNNNATNGTIYAAGESSNITINKNYFIDNIGKAIVFNNTIPNNNTNYNWYGQNSTNYLNGPDAPEGTSDTWLFLNATADPSIIEHLGSSNIVFDLYLYNSTSQSVNLAYFTSPFEFTITSNGKTDKKTAKVGENVTFTTKYMTGIVTAKYGNITQTIEIAVVADSFDELKDLINNATEGSTITLEKDYLFTGGDINGILINKNITIDGNGHVIDGAKQSRIFHVKSGNVTFMNMILQNGYNGGESFGGAIWAESHTSVKAINCTFNSNSARWGGAVSGVNAEECTFNSNQGYDEGGAMYNGEALNCIFNSNTAYTGGALSGTTAVGCIFDSNSADQFGGAIHDGKAINSTFISNIADYKGGALYYGNATNCIFSGNKGKNGGGAMWGGVADSCIFKTDYDTTNVETEVISPIMTAKDATFVYNSSEIYKFNFTSYEGMPIANANVSISVYYKENDTLYGKFSCLSGEGWAVNLHSGNYTAVLATEYEGFNPVRVTITVIKGNSTLKVNDMAFDYGSTGSTTVEFTNALNVTAEVVDHKEAVVTVNGTVITVSNLTVGTYTLKVTTITNDDYNNVTETAKITVNKLNVAITAENAAYVINYGGTYSVILKDSNGTAFAGQTVTFTLNGKNIGSAVTDAKGSASIKLTAAMLKTAKAGTRNLVISFAGDSNYNAASKTVKITINKEKTKITAKKKTFKKSKKVKKYTITLKDSKGKAIKKAKVTIKIKKKTYTAKTNSKGKATFKIKKLTKKGTYKAKITYKGNSYYKKATKTVKIKIK